MAALPKITTPTGMSSKRHRAVRSTSSPMASRRSRRTWRCALGVLELAHPGRVLLLELALQVVQQVTVAVIQH